MPYIIIAKSTCGNLFEIDETFYSVEEANNYMADFTDVADYNINYVPEKKQGFKLDPDKMKARTALMRKWF